MLTAGSFGDEFLNHDVEHGTCCKGKTIYRIVQYSNIVNEKEEENRTVELCSKVGCTSEYQIKAFLFCSSLGFHYR